jgi:hypothetical protein
VVVGAPLDIAPILPLKPPNNGTTGEDRGNKNGNEGGNLHPIPPFCYTLPPKEAFLVVFALSDPLTGLARGQAKAWKDDAKRLGAKRLAEVYRLIDTHYLVAPRWALDPAILITQAFHETGNFTSRWWTERLNPAGIGVTGDPHENEQSHTWSTGADAALSQIAHMRLYTTGTNDTGFFDPREDAYHAAFGTQAMAHIIDDLGGGIWAVDKLYDQKLVNRGNGLYPDIASATPQTEEKPPVALRIDTKLTTRDLGVFQNKRLYITIHNNGNLSSDRFDEAVFVESGGGDGGVLYHFAVDAGGAVQIEKLDHKGVHAGNSFGNATSIAVEMCEGSEPWAVVKENTAQLVAAIILGDPRLDYGTYSKDNYSLDRIVEHRDWGRTVGQGGGVANGNCPRRLIQTDGGIEKFILPRARELVAAATKPELKGRTPLPFPVKEGTHNGFVYMENAKKRRKLTEDAAQYSSPVASPANLVSKTRLRRGRTYTFDYIASGEDTTGTPTLFLVSKNGTHVLATKALGV